MTDGMISSTHTSLVADKPADVDSTRRLFTAGRSPAETHLLLLIEHHPADARLLRDLLEHSAGDPFSIHLLTTLADSLEYLRTHPADVALLDFRLPDTPGINAVKSLRSAAPDLPIVVLTDDADQHLAISCIDAGAQDYLCKNNLQPTALRRAIGYAVTRVREARSRDLQASLDSYRTLASQTPEAGLTAGHAADDSLQSRHAELFRELVASYASLLRLYLERLTIKKEKPRPQMQSLIHRLGQVAGAPHDLIDLHLAAIDDIARQGNVDLSRCTAADGRLFALDMMGLLAEHYRAAAHRAATPSLSGSVPQPPTTPANHDRSAA